jgi:hypothetical protein
MPRRGERRELAMALELADAFGTAAARTSASRAM